MQKEQEHYQTWKRLWAGHTVFVLKALNTHKGNVTESIKLRMTSLP